MCETVVVVQENLQPRFAASMGGLETFLRPSFDALHGAHKVQNGRIKKCVCPAWRARASKIVRSAVVLFLMSVMQLFPSVTRAEDFSAVAETSVLQVEYPTTASTATFSMTDTAMAASPLPEEGDLEAPSTPAVRPGAASSRALKIDGRQADTYPASGRDAAEYALPQGLFEAGESAYARGDTKEAQRLFEKLIGTAPAARQAGPARQRLGQIYRGETLPKASGSVVADAGGVSIARSSSQMGARRGSSPATAVAFTSPQPWRIGARRSQRFEQLLRTDVGDRIFFGPASTEIGTRAKTVLQRQASWLKRYHELYIVVEGHADEPGDDDKNNQIALRRAVATMKLLVSSGFPADRVDIAVRGRQERVATCQDPVCQAQNRRAVVRVMLVMPPRRPGQPRARTQLQ